MFYSQDCESYIHSISSNSGSYPNSETFLYDFYDYCSIVDKMAVSCKDKYKRESLSRTTCKCHVLKIFFLKIELFSCS